MPWSTAVSGDVQRLPGEGVKGNGWDWLKPFSAAWAAGALDGEWIAIESSASMAAVATFLDRQY
jgi:hypothetical protein